jgi:hypothetical protein
MYFDINQLEEIQASQGDPASALRTWWPTGATAKRRVGGCCGRWRIAHTHPERSDQQAARARPDGRAPATPCRSAVPPATQSSRPSPGSNSIGLSQPGTTSWPPATTPGWSWPPCSCASDMSHRTRPNRACPGEAAGPGGAGRPSRRPRECCSGQFSAGRWNAVPSRSTMLLPGQPGCACGTCQSSVPDPRATIAAPRARVAERSAQAELLVGPSCRANETRRK